MLKMAKMFRAVVAVFLVLLCTACPSVTPQMCNLQPRNEFPEISHTVYISDNFTLSGVDDIHQALMEWTQVTRGSVKWTIGHHPTKTDLGDGPKGTCSNSVIIIPVLSDWDIVKEIESSKGNNHTIAAATILSCEFNLMIVVMDNITASAFRPTVLHELGHYLGLKDNNDITTIMHLDDTGTATCVTPKDVKQFCDVWSCDPNKMAPCK